MVVDDLIPIKVRQEKVKLSPEKRMKVADAYKWSVIQLQNSPLSTRDNLQSVSPSQKSFIDTLP